MFINIEVTIPECFLTSGYRYPKNFQLQSNDTWKFFETTLVNTTWNLRKIWYLFSEKFDKFKGIVTLTFLNFQVMIYESWEMSGYSYPEVEFHEKKSIYFYV